MPPLNPKMPEGVNIFREIGAAPDATLATGGTASAPQSPELQQMMTLLQSGQTADMVKAKTLLEGMVSKRVQQAQQPLNAGIPPAPSLRPAGAPNPTPTAPGAPGAAPAAPGMGTPGPVGAPPTPQNPAMAAKPPAPAPAPGPTPLGSPQPGTAPQGGATGNVLLDLVKVIKAANETQMPRSFAQTSAPGAAAPGSTL